MGCIYGQARGQAADGGKNQQLRDMAICANLAVVLVCLVSIGGCGDKTKPELSCTITPEKQICALGERVVVVFTLQNVSDRSLWVLTWCTPLEGMLNDMFDVRRDGEEVPYNGILASRGDPLANSYVLLEPGESTTASVDLGNGYDFSRPGVYRVVFRRRIWYTVGEYADLPRPLGEHEQVELQSNEILIRIESDT